MQYIDTPTKYKFNIQQDFCKKKCQNYYETQQIINSKLDKLILYRQGNTTFYIPEIDIKKIKALKIFNRLIFEPKLML